MIYIDFTMSEQTVRREKGRMEEMEQFFEDVVFAYRTRRTEVGHIVAVCLARWRRWSEE